MNGANLARRPEMGRRSVAAARRRDLEQLWTEHNRATDGTTRYDSEYLEVEAIRGQPAVVA